MTIKGHCFLCTACCRSLGPTCKHCVTRSDLVLSISKQRSVNPVGLSVFFCPTFSLKTYACLRDASPAFITAGSGAHNVSFLLCADLRVVVLSGCVQPPPSGPGVAGPSLPGGAAVPRFTPLLLQRREQAERVLTKSVSAIIVFFALGGRCLCLLKKTHLRHCFFLLFSCSFTLWALLFVIARLLTLTLSVLTFSFGLPRTENQGFSFAEGNFNVLTVRQVHTAISRTVLSLANTNTVLIFPTTHLFSHCLPSG